MPSTPHADRAAAVQQQQHSLPSFAQGFSALSTDHEHDRGHDRALPPLQMHRDHQQQQKNQPRRLSTSPLLVAGSKNTSTTVAAVTNQPKTQSNASSSPPSSSSLSPPQARSSANTTSLTASTTTAANSSTAASSERAHYRVSMAGTSSISAAVSPRPPHSARRKRPRSPSIPAADTYDSSNSPSPTDIVKQEQDVDQLDPTPSPHLTPRQSPQTDSRMARQLQQLQTAPSTSLSSYTEPLPTVVSPNTTDNSNATRSLLGHTSLAPPPPSKRRRVTISGSNAGPLHLNTANLSSGEPALHTPGSGTGGSQAFSYHAHSHSHMHQHQPSHSHTGPSTPISPVVMGFTIQPDDPQAIEQVRSMIAVKQKQKALIESRRGSVAGLAAEGSRRGSVGGLDATSAGGTAGAGGRSSRRGSVAGVVHAHHSQTHAMPAVNIVNATPTSTAAPVPLSAATGSVGKRSSPNGASERKQPDPSPPSLSPPVSVMRSPRAGAGISGTGTRARSPSGLTGARALSPNSFAGQSGQQPQQVSSARLLPPSGGTIASGVSPPQRDGSNREVGHAPTTRRQQVSSPSLQSSSSVTQPSQPAPSAATNPAPNSGISPVMSTGSVTSQSKPQSSQQLTASQGLSTQANNLPPPPNSFARRRASQLSQRGKQKPADLLISPRESASVSTTARTSGQLKTGEGSGGLDAQQQQQYQRATQGPTQTQISLLSASRQRLSSFHSRGDYAALQPVIQSAPPRPGTQPGRFPPMALPTLPPALSQGASTGGRAGAATGGGTMHMRRVPGQVPPTPTALSMQRTQAATGGGSLESANVRLSQPTGAPRIPGPPRTATGATFFGPSSNHPPTQSSSFTTRIGLSSGGIGANLGSSSSSGSGNRVEQGPTQAVGSGNVPTTPATFHRVPGIHASSRTREENKAAFLVQFEQFYDTLSDAQVLKGWFGEQLRRVGKVMRDVEEQIERLKIAEREAARSGAGPAQSSVSSQNPASHAGSSAELTSSSGSGAHGGGSGLARADIERMISDAVRHEVRGWRDEVGALRARVVELEDALHASHLSHRRSSTVIGEQQQVNGVSAASRIGIQPRNAFPERRTSMTIESYTFPPVAPPQPPPPSSSGIERGTASGTVWETRPRSTSPLLAARQVPHMQTRLHPHGYSFTRTTDLRPHAQFSGARELGGNSSAGDASACSRSPTPTPASVLGLAPAPGQPRQTSSDCEAGEADSASSAPRTISHSNSASGPNSVDGLGLGLGGPGRRLSVSAMRYEPRVVNVQERAEQREQDGERDKEREREGQWYRVVGERDRDREIINRTEKNEEDIQKDRCRDVDREKTSAKEAGAEAQRKIGDAKRVSFEQRLDREYEQEHAADKLGSRVDNGKDGKMQRGKPERSLKLASQVSSDEADAVGRRAGPRQGKPGTEMAAAQKEAKADVEAMDTT